MFWLGLVGGRQLCCLQLSQYEAIDRTARPAIVFDSRNLRSLERLKRPEGSVFVGDFFAFSRQLAVTMIAGPGSAQLDPLGQRGDFVVLQLAFRRHLEGCVVNRFDEQTFVRLARDHGGARFAAR